MRLVFMGTPEFAAVVLDSCLGAHDVVAVYTRADAISGRGRTLRPSPVKELATTRGIPVRQPPTLRDVDEQAVLAKLSPDVIVVAAYGLILPREVLHLPPYGCANVHASLLPRWRGAAPVQRAILAGDGKTGVSIMRMEEGLDTGPYDTVIEVPVDDLTTEALTEVLAEAGAIALLRTLDRIERGEVQWIEQDDAEATYADKVTRADVALRPSDSVDVALRKVRASTSQAASRLEVDARPVTVLEARRSGSQLAPGSVTLAHGGLELGVGNGAILVTRLKPDGRSEMDAAAWARGARLSDSPGWAPL
jgi:methionyl-tRNA formyltransferase